MPAYKNKENGSWYVVTQYTDWTGSRKPKCKRGFSTKREAQEWEQKFQQQSAGDLDMSFEAFCEIYTKDLKARLKESTWQTKENIIQKKLLPYFGMHYSGYSGTVRSARMRNALPEPLPRASQPVQNGLLLPVSLRRSSLPARRRQRVFRPCRLCIFPG